MQKKIEIEVAAQNFFDDRYIKKLIEEHLGVNEIDGFRIVKKSLDARQKNNIKFHCTANVFIGEPPKEPHPSPFFYQEATEKSKTVVIAGAGPAGLFAALCCLENGFRPIILERGKEVRERRRDLALLNKNGIVDIHSNYCFGEGGAGTFSDGKLYTRSKKRGSVEEILNLFISFGADKEIAVDAHPHIGTNKLPKIIEEIRKKIISLGGEIHFNHFVNDLIIKGNRIHKVVCENGSEFFPDAFILATGHSGREMYSLLKNKNIQIEPKPFALGVRIEHPQSYIDFCMYHLSERPAFLPPAAYSLVTQAENHGVFSFCMCPGGIIAPASTNFGELVVNGWSPSRRNNPHANSGMVVTVSQQDAVKYFKEDDKRVKYITSELGTLWEQNELLLLLFQKVIEMNAYNAGGG